MIFRYLALRHARAQRRRLQEERTKRQRRARMTFDAKGLKNLQTLSRVERIRFIEAFKDRCRILQHGEGFASLHAMLYLDMIETQQQMGMLPTWTPIDRLRGLDKTTF